MCMYAVCLFDKNMKLKGLSMHGTFLVEWITGSSLQTLISVFPPLSVSFHKYSK